ncbi:MAG: hypothetical protein Q4D38_00080 [Planctomycetia bacterium]|nr:hypothetical protein [Planctomycetia bacterium]
MQEYYNIYDNRSQHSPKTAGWLEALGALTLTAGGAGLAWHGIQTLGDLVYINRVREIAEQKNPVKDTYTRADIPITNTFIGAPVNEAKDVSKKQVKTSDVHTKQAVWPWVIQGGKLLLTTAVPAVAGWYMASSGNATPPDTPKPESKSNLTPWLYAATVPAALAAFYAGQHGGSILTGNIMKNRSASPKSREVKKQKKEYEEAANSLNKLMSEYNKLKTANYSSDNTEKNASVLSGIANAVGWGFGGYGAGTALKPHTGSSSGTSDIWRTLMQAALWTGAAGTAVAAASFAKGMRDGYNTSKDRVTAADEALQAYQILRKMDDTSYVLPRTKLKDEPLTPVIKNRSKIDKELNNYLS